jgi:hypothetical protein
VGDKVYASICHQIYVRVDGPTKQNCRPDQVFITGRCQTRWKVFWTDPEPSYSQTGLRGLTSVKYQGKDVLLVGGEGYLLHIYRIDPDTGVGVPELDILNYLSNLWNMSVEYTIAPYGRMPLWYDVNGTGKRIIGVESFLGAKTTIPQVGRPFDLLDTGAKLQGHAWYFLRNAAASYEPIHIPQVGSTQMVATRTAARSPFADECNAQGLNCAVYFGGYDGNFGNTSTSCLTAPCTFPPLVPVPTHNTGWIVKGIVQ